MLREGAPYFYEVHIAGMKLLRREKTTLWWDASCLYPFVIQEAKEFADADAAEEDNVEARNQLEAYLYNLKNSINDTLERKLNESNK